MEKRKISIIALLFVFMAVSLSSCNVDGDSRPQGWAFGTIKEDYMGKKYIRLDGMGNALTSTALSSNLDKNQRVMLEFYVNEEIEDSSSDYKLLIEVLWMEKIETLYPMAHPTPDTINIDPFIEGASYPTRMAIADNFLTIAPFLMFSDISKHSIALSFNSSNLYNPDTIQLQLNHNAHKDGENYLDFNYYCFDLNRLNISTTDTVVLTIKMPVKSSPHTTKVDTVYKHIKYARYFDYN